MTVGLQNLSNQNFYNVRSIVPPFQEQKIIVRFVEEHTALLNNAIADARREIDLLHEYCTRLVADVVTGKLDVRGAAAELPELVDDHDSDPVDDEEVDDEDAASDDDIIAEAAE